MSEALAHGMTRYTLYALRDRGVVELVSRGIYRLVELPPIGNPDLVTVSLRFPNAVICLVSALAFHDITTQIPHEATPEPMSWMSWMSWRNCWTSWPST